MSSRSLKIINMLREVQDNENNLQIVNAISLKNAEKDLFSKRPEPSTSRHSHLHKNFLDIDEIQEESLQIVNAESDHFALPTTSQHSHPIENTLDITHEIQTENFQTVVKKRHSNLVEYDYSTDEDFSADSDDDHTFQLPPAIDSSDITDFSDYEIEIKEHKHRRNEAYKVHLLKFTDFYDLHDLASATIKNRNKDENCDLVSWLKIKCIKFQKEFPDIMFYRYDHNSDYKKINVAGKGRKRNGAVELKPAYKTMIPISEAKKADIVKLADAGHIPEEVVSWYKNLPCNKRFTQTERLPEPNFDEYYPENE